MHRNELKGKAIAGQKVPVSKTPHPLAPKACSALKSLYKAKITWFVIVPWLIFASYTCFIASPRFESQAKLIIEQPDGFAGMDPSMALLTGLGATSSGSDPELVRAYIYSSDMLEYLESNLSLQSHYQGSQIDWFSRLNAKASRESFLSYYHDHVYVNVDDKSSIVTVSAQGFNPDFALLVTKAIIERAEWYINEIGRQLANEQLKFVQGEHQIIEQKLRLAQTELLNFQQSHKLLDPEAEGLAMQQITYSIEGELASKEAQLRALRAIMSADAPQVVSLENTVDALQQQLLNERDRLSESEEGAWSVSEVLAKFTDLKVNMELALKAYTSSQVSLEKSRIEAYRQLKYLVVVETPVLAEDYAYPNKFYNISLLGVCLLLLFGVGGIVIATVRELR